MSELEKLFKDIPNQLFSILTLNPVFQKIFIFTKELEAKYNFLFKKFPQDVKIF